MRDYVTAVLISGAVILVVLSCVVGRHQAPDDEPHEDTGHEPKHASEDEGGINADPVTGELDPVSAHWLAEISRAESTLGQPVEGSDEWWLAEFARTTETIDAAVNAFHTSVDAALGPDWVALVRRDEWDTAEYWRIVDSVLEETAELQVLALAGT